MSGAEKRLHLDRFELAERGTMWDAENGGEVDATEVAAELRSLRAAVAESPVVRRNAVRAAVDAERARIVARLRELASELRAEAEAQGDTVFGTVAAVQEKTIERLAVVFESEKP